jgi:hypothetical protein
MKYALFLYEDEDRFASLSKEEQGALIGEHFAFVDVLVAAGAMIEGDPLDHSSNARRIRGARVEDGPFADSKHQIGGYYVIEAPDLDAAIEWAAKCPSARDGVVEVRPLKSFS